MKIFTAVLFLLLMLAPAAAQAADKEEDRLGLKSESALLLDAKTGAIIYEKNGYQKMYPASLTKIATAIYAIEKGSLDDVVSVSEHAAKEEGTSVYLESGEKVTLEKLLNGMLINSGNDAADAVAEYLDGSAAQFEQNFNEYLKNEIKVEGTHFKNPSGLYDEKHYTTAYDMALITKYALKNKEFQSIFGTKELNWEGLSWDTTLVTHHLMLKGELPYDGVNGGKTGYVDQSKQTLATSAEKNGLQLIAIVLKGDWKKDVYEDTAAMFDYGFNGFKNEFMPPGKKFSTGGKEFQTEKTELLTVPIDNHNPVITTSGQLLVQSKAGDTIQTIQLQENTPQEIQPVNETKTAVDEPNNWNIAVKTTIGMIVLLIVVVAVYMNKRRRRHAE
ncbi:D-alanyl-D-alanine carboxypeptidase family protein [Niallia taxi]|uniref:D-alanyl-D-alanine carboxypeptidase family protein n=1 Tax=Niallia taxi TaxID=2499688 RepID=UPI0021A32B6F|nr:D-alanyl-D-alanine carboxypeptidase family protein [Niallia taxi]MCT2343884.1 D-alanyl-D-alanine carboxypeptidase [Niallia taxi]